MLQRLNLNRKKAKVSIKKPRILSYIYGHRKQMIWSRIEPSSQIESDSYSSQSLHTKKVLIDEKHSD